MGIFVFFLLCSISHFTNAYHCPHYMKFTVGPETKAPRPEGEVTLQGNIQGIEMDIVEFYWWLFDEKNKPIYIFSEVHNINHNYSDAFVSESHTTFKYGIQTRIRLRVSVHQKHTFRCAFSLKNQSGICSESTTVKFKGETLSKNTACEKDTMKMSNCSKPDTIFGEFWLQKHINELVQCQLSPGPYISMRLKRIPRAHMNNSLSLEEKVWCNVENAIGKPKISMTYTDPENNRSTALHLVERTLNYTSVHLGGAYANKPVHRSGWIICHVTDDVGTYHHTLHIEFKACAAERNLTITQDAEVARPHGKVALTCEMTGVSAKEVDMHWWFIHEENEPIYASKPDRNIEQVFVAHDSLETGTLENSENGVRSHLRFLVSVEKRDSYRCEFYMKDKSFCSLTKTVTFQAPDIVFFSQNSSSNENGESTVNLPQQVMMCMVYAAVGKPKMAFVSGKANRHHIQGHIYTAHDGNIYNATLRATAPGVNVSCEVKDDLGTYVKGQTPQVTENGTSTNTDNYFVIIVPIVLVLLLLSFALVILKWKRTS